MRRYQYIKFSQEKVHSNDSYVYTFNRSHSVTVTSSTSHTKKNQKPEEISPTDSETNVEIQAKPIESQRTPIKFSEIPAMKKANTEIPQVRVNQEDEE
mmetsp:Transcript_16929/g.14837  ORF Transcript_16929/g.14837 Transcript_16929/m.14837 type:complete len:98 (+) Transcript_16929:956-1249(+)